MSIEKLKLSKRFYNALFNEKIKTIETLLTYTKRDILRVPYLSTTGLFEIIDALDDIGLKLRKENG